MGEVGHRAGSMWILSLVQKELKQEKIAKELCSNGRLGSARMEVPLLLMSKKDLTFMKSMIMVS